MYPLRKYPRIMGDMAYDHAREANPRTVHCYADEDMLGRVKKILHRCSGRTAGKRCIQRYMIMFGVRIWKRLQTLRIEGIEE